MSTQFNAETAEVLESTLELEDTEDVIAKLRKKISVRKTVTVVVSVFCVIVFIARFVI